MARGVALSFAVLLAVFEIGSSLKCYQCNSARDPDCKDSLTATNKFIVDCTYQDSFNYNRLYLNQILPQDMTMRTGPTPFCFKVTDEHGSTARTCMQGNSLAEANQQCASLINGRRLKACSYCEKELCNSSSAITASFPVALLALVASYLFYKQ